MALVGRTRQGAGRRLLFFGILATVLILLVDIALNDRSPGPQRTLAAQAWVDKALPLIGDSTSQGGQINALLANGIGMSGAAIVSSISKTASEAATTYKSLSAITPPVQLSGASGLLTTSLYVRSQVAAELSTALSADLSAPGSPQAGTAASTMVSAGQDMALADRAYVLFAQALSKDMAFAPPKSVWETSASRYQNTSVSVFLSALAASTSAAPLHQLTIESVSTTPSAVTTQGQTQILPPATALDVTIVVADTGNQPEPNLTVTAAINLSQGASSVRDFMSLTPGQAQSLTIGALNPMQGVPVTMTVTATPAAGSPTPPASTTLLIEEAPPASPTTTTSNPPTTSTTAPTSSTTG